VVCHGFKQHKPADMQSLSYAARDNRRILQTIFESPNHDAAVGIRSSYLRTRGADHDEHNFDMLHSAFKTCMDTATVEAEGSKPLTDFIVSINETWPATDFTSKVGSDYDGLLKATLMLEELGIPTLHSNCQGLSILANPWASDKVCLPSTSPQDRLLTHRSRNSIILAFPCPESRYPRNRTPTPLKSKVSLQGTPKRTKCSIPRWKWRQ
jgi:hypothetical protein